MLNSHHTPIVRSIDVGYGHVKFSEGDDERKAIRCDTFPSQSPPASPNMLGGAILHRRDTFLVPVDGRVFEVGKDVAMASDTHQESEILDDDYCLSAGYAARLYGALNYLLPGLPAERAIDRLVLGLPMNTFVSHSKRLQDRFEGELEINTRGDKVTVRACSVFPQPLGAYNAYLAETRGKSSGPQASAPMALVVDPGYNTVDWFVCKGLKPSEKRSGASLRGMSAVLRVIAEKMIADIAAGGTVSQLVRLIDAAITEDRPLRLHGRNVPLEPYLPVAAPLFEEAAQAIKNKVGAAIDIDVIIICGGGARLYAPALAAKFQQQSVVTLANPAFANVRGFQLMGWRLAQSAQRAAAGAH